MSDQDMQQLCRRVIATQRQRSFARACEFIADCANLDFFEVVKVCQPIAAEARA